MSRAETQHDFEVGRQHTGFFGFSTHIHKRRRNLMGLFISVESFILKGE